MKLKIDDKGGYKVVSVAETVSPKDAEVLKAGIRRMIQMENKTLVLDLTAAAPGALGSDLDGLRSAAATLGLVFIVACPETGRGDVATLAEAETKAQAPLSYEDTEKLLTARLAQLQKIRDEAKLKLETAKKTGDDLNSIRREGSDHRWRIKEFERMGQDLMKDLKSREDSKELTEKESKVRETVKKVFGPELLEGSTAPKGATPAAGAKT